VHHMVRSNVYIDVLLGSASGGLLFSMRNYRGKRHTPWNGALARPAMPFTRAQGRVKVLDALRVSDNGRHLSQIERPTISTGLFEAVVPWER
jgi:hypothetical protein